MVCCTIDMATDIHDTMAERFSGKSLQSRMVLKVIVKRATPLRAIYCHSMSIS